MNPDELKELTMLLSGLSYDDKIAFRDFLISLKGSADNSAPLSSDRLSAP